nr:GDP-mannose 4,6-dehydratase [Candidatus Sigynarchaeum springense]MDO8115915.1 GDP-mannose 4,6-dehydratase [Candidatus Sigynarchaeota archaeon]
MKALVTGIEGFVGPYLADLLESQGIEIIGTYLTGNITGDNRFHMDVTDEAEVSDIIKKVRPDYIFHLAGFSSVAASFSDPDKCKKINVAGTKNILQAVVDAGIKPRVLVVSSAEVYGKPVSIPINEHHPLSPLSPYAESRIEQERLCAAYVREYKLHIVISRSFNHSGPGQSDAFVLSNFSKQIALIEKGVQSSLKVGNLDAIRDFSDVQDVVKAYYLLLKKGKRGETLNVCSGKGYAIKMLLGILLKMSKQDIVTETDPARLRPSDIPILVGDNHACISRTGWMPMIPIEKTLENLLSYWREK